MQLLLQMLRMLVRPSLLIEAGRDSRSLADGALPVAVVGVVWALFCAILFAAGHGPTVSLLPVPKQHYYLFQAIVLVPLLVGLWWLIVQLAWRLSGASAEQRRPLATSLGFAYAAPLLWLFVMPDLAIYAWQGHAAMGRLLRYYAPLAPLWTLVLGTLAIRRITAVRPGRALGAMACAYLLQALVAGVILR